MKSPDCRRALLVVDVQFTPDRCGAGSPPAETSERWCWRNDERIARVPTIFSSIHAGATTPAESLNAVAVSSNDKDLP
jgi:hypothetical protein